MGNNIVKESFGYSARLLDTFFNKNDFVPKGTFQIKKRGSGYYWYYTLSTNTTGRVKYLSKAFIISRIVSFLFFVYVHSLDIIGS